SSGPILGTLAEVVSDAKVDVAGVVDVTQIEEVLRQWEANGNASWKTPALQAALTRAPFSGTHPTPYAPGSVHDSMHAQVTAGDDRRLHRPRRAPPRRLRLRPVAGRADRDPLRRRRPLDAALAGRLRLRRRERPRPVPDPGRRARRGRKRPARDPRRPELVPALRALRAAARGRQLARGLGRDLEPPLEPAPARGLDLRR